MRSMDRLVHAMNLKVVAEGVELIASWDALGRLGCDLIQGYLVSKPLGLQEFAAAWMKANACHAAVEASG